MGDNSDGVFHFRSLFNDSVTYDQRTPALLSSGCKTTHISQSLRVCVCARASGEGCVCKIHKTKYFVTLVKIMFKTIIKVQTE